MLDKRDHDLSRRAEYPVVHGFCDDGERVSLLNCFDLDYGYFERADPEGPVHYGNMLVNGALFGLWTDSNDPLISRAEILFDCGRAWINRSGFDSDSIRPSLTGFDLSYKDSDGEALYWGDEIAIGAYSTLASYPLEADRSGTVHLREESRFRLLPAAPIRLSRIVEFVESLEALLSLGCLRLCRLERLLVIPTAHGPESMGYGTFHRRARYPAYDGSPPQQRELLFGLQDIPDVPASFDRWLQRSQKLRTVLNLYLSALYSDEFVDRRVVSLAQACEVFHRRFREKRAYYVDPTIYKGEVLPALLRCLPTNVAEDAQAVFTARFANANAVSLRSRIERLVAENQGAVERFFPDWGELVAFAGHYRDQLTHHNKVGAYESREDTQRMVDCASLLSFTLELCLLAEVGFNSGEVENLLNDCDTYYRRYAHRRPYWRR